MADSTRRRRSRLDDPTAEDMADVIGERTRAKYEDLIRRTSDERDYTPRRYEQPVHADPVMPSGDSDKEIHSRGVEHAEQLNRNRRRPPQNR